MRPSSLAILLLLHECNPPFRSNGDLAELVDLSVNQASATVEGTGDAAGLTLRTEAGSNAVGAFNGSGIGNKAIAGVPGWDGRPLGDLTGLAVETDLVTGTRGVYFNVIADLSCDGTRLALIVADTSDLTATTADDGSSRYDLRAEEEVWRAVGGLDDLLPAHTSADAGTLSSVVDAYPDACLRDAATGDNGMPAGVVTSSVLLILGDSTNTAEQEHLVGAIELGFKRYEVR